MSIVRLLRHEGGARFAGTFRERRERTLRLGRDCRVRTMFRVARDDSAQLRVVQRYRGRTTSARLLAPRLGSRGLDERLQAPAAL